MIKVEKTDSSNIKIDRNEVFRYLGYKNIPEDDNSLNLIEKCIKEVETNQELLACYERFSISVTDDGKLDLGFMITDSENLKKNLLGCDEIIVFAATTGIKIDRLIRKYTLTSPSHAVVLQAAGAAAIEGWCDEICRRFENAEKKNKKYLRPRFSPGYGDFPLEAQKSIFSVLDCERKIGLTLTKSNLMVPTKSVSALIGISRTDSQCKRQGCEICEKKNCEFRRI